MVQSYSTAWFTWTPTAGPLTVTLPQGVANSVWLPAIINAVAFASSGVTFYTTQATGNELVPIPSDTTSLTLTGVSPVSGTMQVFASAAVLTPTRTIGG
jgi:hypothetical protein